MEKEAAMVVDYQNGFARKETSELYVEGGESIAPIINNTIQSIKNKGGIIVSSKDMHREGNISFAQNFIGKISITEVGPDDPRAYISYEEIVNWTEEKNGLSPSARFSVAELKAYVTNSGGKAFMWPKHCVVNTEGSEYYSEFDSSLIDIEVAKGYTNSEHPYSAYPGIEIGTKRELIEIFEDENVKKIKVMGLASDWCVKDTALDLAKTGKFLIELILKATKAVDPASEIEALRQMREVGVKIID